MKVIARIVSSLEDAIFLPADFVVRCGDTGRELFFLRRGEAGVFATKDVPPVWGKNIEVKSYKAGDYFGELSMLTSKPRAAWIMAKTYLVISKLSHDVVEKIKDEFPEAFTALVQSMVRSFSLKATTAWPDVAAAWSKKVGTKQVGTDELEDCFVWFCQQAPVDLNICNANSDDEWEDELSAKAFEIGLKKLHVKEIDRMVLWADLDSDNSGFVSFDEFSARISLDEDWGAGAPGTFQSAGAVKSFTMENGRSFSKRKSFDAIQDRSSPRRSSLPRSSILFGQRQIEADVQHLLHKIAIMHNEMQSMGNILRNLVTSENVSNAQPGQSPN